MNKVFAIIGILSGIGFGVLGVMFGEFLPQAKIPFIIFGAILTLGGVAILFWSKIAGEPEKLPEEEITITAAKDSPTGQATVRIPLDGLEKPVQGKRCYVEATADLGRVGDYANSFPQFLGKAHVTGRLGKRRSACLRTEERGHCAVARSDRNQPENAS